MRPRSEGIQHSLKFKLTTSPAARTSSYTDCYGNMVYHFDIPGMHRQLTITAEAIVVFTAQQALPDRLGSDAWQELDAITRVEDHWDFLNPSTFVQQTPLLAKLARELHVRRRDDPLLLLRELTTRMYKIFDYDTKHTEVDSPIDVALEARRGVCQDFAHIMIGLVRPLGIPCRYVSGYLFHRVEDHDRSEQDSTHAWVEAFLPGLGWVGFDPTNNLVAGGRHIRAAVGRDYADVPPTKGVFRGKAKSKLEVGVRVMPTEAPIEDVDVLPASVGEPTPAEIAEQIQLQMQQQQQQQ